MVNPRKATMPALLPQKATLGLDVATEKTAHLKKV
jgi:hypothetical protein